MMTALASAVIASSIVIVDVPDDLSPSLVEATLRSCNLALGPGRCRTGAGPDGELEHSYIAELRAPADAENLVTIELKEGSEPFALVATRSLSFHDSDMPDHRWATAGVVIAALVVSAETASTLQRENEPVEASPPEPPSEPPPTPPRRAPAPTRPPVPELPPAGLAFRLDLAGLAGPGFDTGPWRIGGQLRSSLAGSQLPALAWVSVGAARSEGTFAVNWYSGHAGLGLHFPTGLPLVDIEGRLGGSASFVQATAREGSEQQTESAWRWGAVGALDIVVLASEHLHTVVSCQATATWPVLDVELRNELVGREPAARWAALVGLRWAP
jgi:hypothetical protein